MKLKELLQKLKEKLISEQNTKKEEIELENHDVDNGNTYRLHFVSYSKFRDRKDNDRYTLLDWKLKPFKFPESFEKEEGYKVLSFLIDQTEKYYGFDECSCKGVIETDRLIDTADLGFERTKEYNIDKTVDLFTVSGRLEAFIKSDFYPNYFEWYIENVTQEEVEEIYNKHNMTFKNPYKSKAKMLKLTNDTNKNVVQ